MDHFGDIFVAYQMLGKLDKADKGGYYTRTTVLIFGAVANSIV
jgi:hypothetical protein